MMRNIFSIVIITNIASLHAFSPLISPATTPAPTPSPTSPPTSVTASPTSSPVSNPICPTTGYSQVGSYGADIAGCGLEGCNARYQDNYANIDACASGCNGRTDCLAFSWAPFNDDTNHSGKTVCTLYNANSPTTTWGRGQQIFCKKD